jgi:DNA-binding HxlR family transcriptional regulator
MSKKLWAGETLPPPGAGEALDPPEPIGDERIAQLRRVLHGSAINHVLLRIGDRWTWSVLQQAFLGVRRFDDFQAALGIPRQTLTDRLRTLVEIGLLRQELYQDRPPRAEYRLTKIGLALYPRALLAWSWDVRWGVPPANMPRRLSHRICGHELRPLLVCGRCTHPIADDSLERQMVDPGIEPVPAGRARRWAGGLPGRREQMDEPHLHFPRLASDRYAMLIIVAVLLGCRYFDEIRRVVDIGTSVLAVRLEMLGRYGLLEKLEDPADARRFVYRLGAAAGPLRGYLLLLSRWGQEHLLKGPSTLRALHTVCGQLVEPQVVCEHCRQPVNAWDVERI